MSTNIACPVCGHRYLRADAAEDEYQTEPHCDHWLGRWESDVGFRHGLAALEVIDLWEPSLSSAPPTFDAVGAAFGKYEAVARALFCEDFGRERIGTHVLTAMSEPLGLRCVTVENTGSMLGWRYDDYFVADPPSVRRELDSAIKALSRGLARLAAQEHVNSEGSR